MYKIKGFNAYHMINDPTRIYGRFCFWTCIKHNFRGCKKSAKWYVKKYLIIKVLIIFQFFNPTGSSCQIERLFSKAKQILTDKRNRLKDDTILEILQGQTAEAFKAQIEKLV